MPLVLITGLPGSGKSTLAASLGAHLDLPVIAKDRFKEILFDTLGSRDMAWSRQLGRAAIALQYDAMRTVKDAVVDSALWTGRSEPELEALGVPMVQVYCECPFDIARQRFFGRLRTGDRHPGFAEQDMTPEDYERFRPLTAPLRLPVPLVRVDTATAVDTDDLAVHVRAALRSLAPTRQRPLSLSPVRGTDDLAGACHVVVISQPQKVTDVIMEAIAAAA